MKQQEYNFTVTYKSGQNHAYADCVSRYPKDAEDKSSSVDSHDALNIASELVNDASLLQLIDHMAGRNMSTDCRAFRRPQMLSLIDKFHYEKNFQLNDNLYLLVISRHLRCEVLTFLHDRRTAELLGLFKS